MVIFSLFQALLPAIFLPAVLYGGWMGSWETVGVEGLLPYTYVLQISFQSGASRLSIPNSPPDFAVQAGRLGTRKINLYERQGEKHHRAISNAVS
jgi:hypothetical protein